MKAFLLLMTLIPFVALAQTYDLRAAAGAQQALDEEYANPETSPLAKSDLRDFKRLDFFPLSEKFIVTARLVRSANAEPFGMKTTGNRLPMYVEYGELHFSIEGRAFSLKVYRNVELSKKPGFEAALFLPFSDLTNGKQTYIGGRYLDLSIPAGQEIVLDFNRAYNPYCAYNHKYSCPIVSSENDLDFAIEAGVKKFHD